MNVTGFIQLVIEAGGPKAPRLFNTIHINILFGLMEFGLDPALQNKGVPKKYRFWRLVSRIFVVQVLNNLIKSLFFQNYQEIYLVYV